ncbi:MAG: type IX secretion system membrane protein PorP/SprF [Bacteroidia bacterium]
MNIYLSDLSVPTLQKKLGGKHLIDMKKTLTTIAFALGTLAGFAQQDPQFSQYMYNKMFMNPAYAGMRQALCGTMIARQQWSGFDGAPQSGVLSVDGYVNPLHGGLGLNVMYDKLGFEQTMAYRLAYSFHLTNIAGGTLGIGLEGGAISKRLGPTGSDQWIATTNWQNDQAIPPQLQKTTFDLGFGLWYQRQNLWFGISSTHLPANSIDDGQSSLIGTPPIAHDLVYQMARHYYITGGYNWATGGAWEIRPSFLVKSDATITSFDFNVLALYDQKFWMGASYRFQDAVIPMVGFQMPHSKIGENGGLKVGFAYDYTTSNLRKYNNGSFELFLNYCYPIVIPTKREGHGDVRIFD